MATQALATEKQHRNVVRLAEKLKGRMKYMLVIIALLHFATPLSETGQVALLIYFLMYTALLGFGVFVASANVGRLRFMIGVILCLVPTGSVWVFSDEPNLLFTITTFSLLLLFIAIVTLILAEFVIISERVTRDVLFAALAVYLLLGNMYTTIFALLNFITIATIGEQAFILSSNPDAEIAWQRLYYFSYTTLTTLGYGDILPVTSVAQSFATSETIIGVLYTSVMIARLVSLYQTELSEQANDTNLPAFRA